MKMVLVCFSLCVILLGNCFAENDIKVQIIDNPDPSITEVEGYGEIKTSCDNVWSVLTDLNNLNRWMPNCQSSEYLGKDPQGRDLAYLIVGMSIYGSKDMTNAYTSQIKQGIKKLSFEKIDGSWNYLKGYTIVKDRGQSCLILSHVAGRIGIPLPNTILIAIAKDQMESYILNLRRILE